MGKLGISMAEKRLLRHLRLGGRPDDEIGRQLIWKFCTKVWTEPSVAPALRQHGVTIEELAEMYLRVIESLMPRPWMNVGGPLLVPTQWFMEPHRLENLLVEVSRDTKSRPRDDWLQHLIARASELAEATREVHDERYGPPTVEVVQAGGVRSAGGCASTFLLAAVLGLAAAFFVAQ